MTRSVYHPKSGHALRATASAFFDATAHQRYDWCVMQLSRRNFACLAGARALAGPPLSAQTNPPTAQQVVERIQRNAGVPWQPQSLDTFKAGDPNTQVTGIATTGMATMDV